MACLPIPPFGPRAELTKPQLGYDALAHRTHRPKAPTLPLPEPSYTSSVISPTTSQCGTHPQPCTIHRTDRAKARAFQLSANLAGPATEPFSCWEPGTNAAAAGRELSHTTHPGTRTTGLARALGTTPPARAARRCRATHGHRQLLNPPQGLAFPRRGLVPTQSHGTALHKPGTPPFHADRRHDAALLCARCGHVHDRRVAIVFLEPSSSLRTCRVLPAQPPVLWPARNTTCTSAHKRSSAAPPLLAACVRNSRARPWLTCTRTHQRRARVVSTPTLWKP